MEDDMIFKSTIDNKGYNPDVVKFEKPDLKKISFLEFLAAEFIATTSVKQLGEIGKEAFARFARAGNDDAAEEALALIYKCMVRTNDSYPFEMDISVEAFAVRKRLEERDFFEWLEKAFWSIQIYSPASGEEKTNGIGYFYLERRYPKTQAAMVTYAAQIWGRAFDELGRSAFSFLCNCVDSRRFCDEAEAHIAAIEKYAETYHPSDFYGFSIPPEDVSMVLQQMGSAMPKDKDLIKTWGGYAADPKTRTPQKIRELLGHAYVKAGGTVF